MKDIYICPWLLALKYFGRTQTVRGYMYMSLVAEVQIDRVQEERLKDVYIRRWLLGKIGLAHKGLNQKKIIINQ